MEIDSHDYRDLDVILINSPSRLYGDYGKIEGERELTPYGLGCVASDIQERLNVNVGLLDAEYLGLSIEQIINCIGAGAIVGMNVQTPNFVPTMILAKEIAKHGNKIVFGGPHATLSPSSILKYVPQGIVVRGDGEGVFARIIAGEPLKSIDGLVINQKGKIISIGPPNVIHDLDALPLVDRRFFVNEPFEKNGKRTMTFLSSRGCFGNCGFCVTPCQYEILREGGAKRVRFRNLGDVVAEVARNKEIHNLELAQFIDDVMIYTPKRAKEFLSYWGEYGLSGNMEFTCLMRPDTIKRYQENGLLKELYSAGLRRLSLGIETGHDRGRKLVSGRGGKIDPKYVEENVVGAVRACYEIGIETKGFFIIGLPNETYGEIQQTLDFMYKLRGEGLNKAALFPLKVYPSTYLWEEAVKMGFTPDELGHYDAPNISRLITQGYGVKDSTRDGYVQLAQLSEVPQKELNEICQENMRIFNESGDRD